VRNIQQVWHQQVRGEVWVAWETLVRMLKPLSLHPCRAPKLVEIIAAVPEEHRAALLPQLKVRVQFTGRRVAMMHEGRGQQQPQRGTPAKATLQQCQFGPSIRYVSVPHVLGKTHADGMGAAALAGRKLP
jgi:hypothetical protein